LGSAEVVSPLRRLNRICWIFALAVFLINGVFLYQSLVEFPHTDEWGDFLEPRHFSRAFDWRWIFAPQNNHPRVLHALIKWLQLPIDGGSFVNLALFNFLVFAVSGLLLLRYLEKRFFVATGWLAIALASSLYWEVHTWPNQGFFTHFWACSCLAFALLCSESKWRNWAPVPAVFATLATSAGTVFALVFGANAAALALFQYRTPFQHKKAWNTLALGIPSLLVCALWHLFAQMDNVQKLISPFSLHFWNFYLNLISLPLSHESQGNWQGIILLLALVGFVVWEAPRIFRSEKKLKDFLFLFGLLGVFLASALGISAGRGEHLFMSKIPRYAGLLLPLFPITWVLFARWAMDSAFARNEKAGQALLYLGCCFFVLPWINNFDWKSEYETVRAAKLKCRSEIVDKMSHPEKFDFKQDFCGWMSAFEERFSRAEKIGEPFTIEVRKELMNAR
jgi:hypothetical protein